MSIGGVSRRKDHDKSQIVTNFLHVEIEEYVPNDAIQ